MAIDFTGFYAQDFDTLPTTTQTWQDDVTLAGWFTTRTGTGTTILAGTGSSSAGGLYSFGTGGSTDRALGSVGSGNVAAGNFSWGVSFRNATGGTIDTLYVQYQGEQWRYGGTASAQTVDLQYSTSIQPGIWLNADSLDFTSPIISGSAGAIDGNAAPNRSLISSALTNLALQAGETLQIRWSDPDHPGSDHGLAIDDLKVSVTSLSGPPPAGLTLLQSNGATFVDEGGNSDSINVLLDRQPTANVTVTLAEAAGIPQLVLQPTQFVFTSANWAIPQTITLSAIDDTAVEGSHATSLQFTVASADASYDGLRVTPLPVTINDNDGVVTRIHSIQGSGGSFDPAFAGVQTIEGVVVASFPGANGLNGFFVQEEDADADADPLTSESLFVFDPSGRFSGGVGSKVRITGDVREFISSSSGIAGPNTSSLTQIYDPSTILDLGTVALPAPVSIVLPVADVTVLERYEGMLVTVSAFSGELIVTDTFKLGRFGQVGLSAGERLDQFTQVNAPSVSGYAEYLDELLTRSIILDDGSSRQNPDPVIHARGGQPLNADNTLRGGDAIGSISGVLDERFEGYRVQTLSPASFTPTNPRSSTPPPVEGDVKVGTFNVLNYFSDLDTNAVISIPGGVSFEPRGANTAIELARQQEKLVTAILGLDTDVLGLIEIENDGPATLANLVDALNAQAGAGTYAFIDDTALVDDPNPAPNAVGTDAIKVAILYKPGAVLPSGAARSYAEADLANPIFDRPPVAQTFVTPAGGRFSVVVNHFKSKGSAAGLSGDADQGNGQGFSNATRVAQSQALLAFVEALRTSSADDDVLVLGDLNAYAREDPINTLTNGGLVNLFGDDSYSYQFNGQWGSLDHALATASLTSQVSGASKWPINADEPVVLDYNTEFKSTTQINSFFNAGPFRTSDHDPIVIGLTLTPTSDNPIITSGSAFSIDEANTNGITGPSSSATPYLTSSNPEVQYTSVFTVGDAVNGYRMVGIPDGMGAFDNGDGSFTLLMNHELANTRGIARAHDQPGAFVSRWVIDKATLEVLSIEDFLRNGTSVYLSNNDPSAGVAHSAYLAAATTILSRLCSADLAPVSAFQWSDPATGTVYGTEARIFLSGEESSGSVTGVGPETTTLFGREFAWVATDDANTPLDETGTAWELPHGGIFGWENNVANPHSQRKTIVIGLDDGNGGQLYLWVGDKRTSGTVVERAGLTRQGPDDTLYVVKVPSLSSLDGAGVPAETLDAPVQGAFSLVNLGDVSALTLDGLEAASDAAGASQFLRPEDGQWDPANPSDFYFVTTSRYDQSKDGIGSQVGRSRLYRLRFSDISQPQLGGTITALLDGTEAGNMFDNITIAGGKVIIQEDVGNQQHLGKIWSYDIATDSLTELGSHDRQRFGDVGVPAVAPFNQDEESSGVIDMSEILGEGTFLLNVQAHYAIPGELAEGGQLLLMRTNAASGQALVATLIATDPENDPLSFSISGGEDAADFTIDPSSGELRFAVAPDAENPADADGNNVYLVEVSVSDGNSAPVSQAITVTVNPVNESPTNTTAAAVTVPENTTFVTTASGTDAEGAALAFAISGGADAARFSIDPATGVLRFLSAPNFEAPTDSGASNSYVVGVTVSDGLNAPVHRSVVVSVTDVKEAPTPSNALTVTPIGSVASGTAGVAEIVAHDPTSQKLFSLNGAGNRLDVISIADPAAPALVGTIDLSSYGAVPNSVAVKNGLIAVAMEASPKTNAGKVVFFTTTGVFQNQLTVGAQPDMLTFTPDGLKVLVANEGEPNVGDTVNPEGSVSIISLAAGVAAATVKTASFSAFNGQEDKLRGQGVRISAGKSFAVDAEPESIAVSPDGRTARITLQENSAVAVLDLTTDTITAIQALGLKDYSQGLPQVKTFDFNAASLPSLGTTATGQTLKLGGFSGLHFEGIDAASGNLNFITNTDRGPNGEPSNLLPAVAGNERPFALPAFTPELVRFQLDQNTGAISITSRIALKRADGSPLTGLPNLQAGGQGTPYTDEVGVDLAGNQLANDPFGADLEGIVVAPDGSFWLPDEYRPAIYHFDATGTLIDRFIPAGTAAAAGQPAGSFGTEALPAVYGQFRRANRGFEAIALEGNRIYAFIQTNLDNRGAGSLSGARDNGVIRIVEFDTTTNTVSGEYVYVMRDTTAGGTAKTDKIGDAVSLGGGRFLVAERDDRTGADSNKLIYEINLKGATNVRGTALATASTGTTLESLTPAGLAANGIRPVDKRLVVNAAAIGYTGVSKLEGMAVVDGDTIALINDNDFQMAGTIAGDGSAPLNPNPEPIRLGLIDFTLSNGLDASDRDVDGSSGSGGKISINPQPVFGMYMPDGIAAYMVAGRKYFITANEGDDRDDFLTPDETIRVGGGGYVLDPNVFPNAAALKNNAVLGRLTVSSLDGNLDGDGDVDRIQAYGARSFSIWDEAGNRVFDSGDALELITAAQVPALFNSDGTSASFDTRSDNKGPEPEGVAIGQINGRTYAFVGLERVGGFITYDVTDPLKPVFVTYTNPAANPIGTPGQSDRSPEGIAFISAADSPTGQPLVVTGNEVSGSTTIYSLDTLPNGVASGDGDQQSIVLWTRSTALGHVTFDYATTADFSQVAGTATVSVTNPQQPVKVEVSGLIPGTDYYYRATDAAGSVAEGRFTTAAAPGQFTGLHFGVSGDWRGEIAPYPSIGNAAGENLDFFVALGDTIYADVASPGLLNPDGSRKAQATTLEEFRAKHSEVYSARFGLNTLADLRGSTAIYAGIDDHEVTNDFAGGAPAASDPRFGSSQGLINDTDLFENGLAAFQEYNPIRDVFYGNTGDPRTAGERNLYRYNTFGSDAATFLLDARSFRDPELVAPDTTNPADVGRFLSESLTQERTMLGAAQFAQLKADLLRAQQSGITWKFVMVPEPIQELGIYNTDAYEGYARERTELLTFIEANAIRNVVFVAADIHGTVVNNLTYTEVPGGPRIATDTWEITTGSVGYSKPFGQTVVDIATAAGLLSLQQKAFYDTLPIAPDADTILNDKDDFLRAAFQNLAIGPAGYDPIGLDNNLAAGPGSIGSFDVKATLLQGDYVSAHTYGWTQFDIDEASQQLTVTTYGIDPYTESDLLANPAAVIGRSPRIVSQFTVDPEPYTLQILSYYGESGLLGVQTAPIMGALIDKFDDQYTNTIKLGEGDTFIPGPWLIGGADPSLNTVPGIGSTGLGRPDIAIFNAFGTDASALGNHEFDLGSPVLQGAIAPGGAWAGAQFPFITANLSFSADSSLRGLADASIGGTASNAFAGKEASSIKGRIAPYAVVTKGGEKIGLVGATTYDLLSKSSPNGTVPKDDGLPSTDDLQEVAAYLQAAVDSLRAQGVNKIVMVDQLDTIERNKALAPLVSGIDVMVAGGGHERLGDANDVPAPFNGHDADFVDTFPIVTAGADGKPVLIVTTDTEFSYLGRLVVDFDANGEIILSNLNSLINGAYAATETNLQKAYGTTDSAAQIVAGSSIGSRVKGITEAINNLIVSKDGNIFGYTNVYLEGDRVFGRAQEVNLGDITADANLAKARAALGSSAVLASLKNGGGLRASIGSIGESGEKLPPASSSVKPAGAISQLDVENALRFDNKLMVFDTTPAGLLAILNYAAGLAPGNGGYAQIGGVRFSYDPTRPAGQKVQDVAIYDETGNLVAKVADNGVLLAGAPATIGVVVLNFTANGGDGYPIKANGDNFRYLLANGSLSAPVNEALDFTAGATFASVGITGADLLGEQKAFEDFLLANHATPATAYGTADTPASLDQRIQNLQVKADTVFPGVDLSTYVRVGRYDLPEPTRTQAPTNSLLAQEVSAVTFNQDTGTLFVLGDGGTSVVQVSKSGELIDSMTLAPGGSPQGTDFYDPEGLTYVGNGQFVLVEERDRQANLFTYVAGGSLTRADAKTVKLGTTIGNIGLEGLTYDPQTGGFIFVKETQPEGIFQTSIEFDAGTASNGSASTVNSVNLFDPSLAGLADFADVFALSNLDYLMGQSDYSNLLVLSQESGKVLEVDRNGHVLSFLTIRSDSGNPLSVANQQHEGLTMDDSGYLYIVSENGGGDFDHPQLWVYAPSTVANLAPTALALTNTVASIEENTPTSTRIKVADVVVTDDGQGANALTVTGADAAFFEVESSGLYIKAGTVLDYETKTSYSITVAVDDPTLGSSPDATTNFNLTVTDVVNEGGPPPSTNGLVITEVAPWSSGNSPVAADWFELTNTGSTAIDISGWKIDDNSGSFVAAVPLSGITSIAAGESVIFIEGASPNTAFLSNWFGASAPAGLQIGTYSGSGVGLSTGGDAVNIYDPNGVLKSSVAFGPSPAPPSLASFDNAALLNNSLTPVTTLSVAGVNGAFTVTDSLGNTEIGSPGRITAVPEPASLIISEVTPWSSGNSSYAADWFEITNTGSTAVDISGWMIDDNSNAFASAVTLNGISSIGAGQSVVFIEGNAATTDAFKAAWFGSSVPADFRIGTYSGSGVGLSTDGDAVNLFDASGKRITGVSFGASTTGFSFDNGAGEGSDTLPLPTIDTLSQAGEKGAFLAADGAGTGSPGSARATATLALGNDLIVNPSAFDFDFGNNLPAAVALQARFFDAQGQPLPRLQTLATAIGQASGLPAGFNADAQPGVLGDGLFDGSVAFFFTDLSSGATTPLTLSGSAQTGFLLSGGGFGISATLTPATSKPDVLNTTITVGGEDLIGLDLSGLTNQLNLGVEVFREAAYNSTLGLYLSDRSTGDVIDPLTGAVASGGTWAGSEAAYRQAAVANALWTGTTPNQTVATLSSTLSLGNSLRFEDYVLLPFIQVADTNQVYVAGVSRNADNFGHIQLIGTNTFGFEDLPGGGDADFDDLILRVNTL